MRYYGIGMSSKRAFYGKPDTLFRKTIRQPFDRLPRKNSAATLGRESPRTNIIE
jgi:hypothetical protein